MRMGWTLVLTLLLCGIAAAQDPLDKAERLLKQGKVADAQRVFEAARNGPPERAALAERGIARCHQAAKRPADAIAALRRALAIYEKRFGDTDRAETAACLNELGEELNQHAKHRAEALKVHRRALAIRRRLFGEVAEPVAESLHNVSVTLVHSDPKQALPLSEQSVAIIKRVYPRGHIHVVYALQGLVACLKAAGNEELEREVRAEAQALYQRVVAVAQRREVHREGLRAYQRGRQLLRQGEPAEAREAYLRASDLWERARAPKDSAAIHSYIAATYAAEGNGAAAVRHRRRAVERRRQDVGLFDHPDVAGYLSELGAELNNQQRFHEALRVLHEAIEIQGRLGLTEVKRRPARIRLAWTLQNLNRYAEALEIYRGIYDAVVATRGPRSKEVADALFNRAVCLRGMGELEKALGVLRQALAIQKELGNTDRILRLVSWIAVCLVDLKRPAEAVPVQERLLDLTRKHPDLNYPPIHDGIFSLARSLWDAGRREEALKRQREALALMRKQRPKIDSGTWGMHQWLFLRLFDLKRHAEAIDTLLDRTGWSRKPFQDKGTGERLELAAQTLRRNRVRLLAIDFYRAAIAWRQEHAKPNARLVELHMHAADLLTRFGRDKEGLVHADAGLRLCRDLGIGDSDTHATLYHCRAVALKAPGDHREVLKTQERCVAMRRRLHKEPHVDLAHALTTLGATLGNVGRPEEAQAAYAEAGKIIERTGADEHLRYTLGWYRGMLMLRLYRPRDAMRFLNGALPYARKLSPTHVADLQVTMASALLQLGRPTQALSVIEQALATLRRLRPTDLGPAINTRAACLRHLGRHRRALPDYLRSLDLARRRYGADHIEVAVSLQNAGVCLNEMGRYKEALACHEESLAIRRRLLKGDSILLANAMTGLAYSCEHVGDLNRALSLHQEALAMARRLLRPDSANLLPHLKGLTRVLAGTGRLAEAFAASQETMRIARRGWYEIADVILSRHGALLRKLGRPAEGIPLIEEAIAHIEALRHGARGLGVTAQATYFAELLRRSYPYGHLVLNCLAAGRPDDALGAHERGRARGLLDLLQRSRFDPFTEALRRAEIAGETKRIETLRDNQRKLAAAQAKVDRFGHAAARVAKDRAQAKALEAKLAAARTELSKLARERGRLIRDILPIASPARPAEIRAFLKEKERLLAYRVTSIDAVLLVVPGPGKPIRSYELHWPSGKPVTTRDLTRAVHDYLLAIGGPGITRGMRVNDKTASKLELPPLFEALMPAEAWRELKQMDRVYLLPKGPLFRLPFETLTTTDGKRWLDEGPPIVYASSASMLLWCKRRKDEQAKRQPKYEVVALGDPNFLPDKSAPPKLPEQGLLITQVVPGSNAAKAGLQAEDVLLTYDSKPTPDGAALKREIRRVDDEIEENGRKAEPVELRIWRAGQEKTLSAQPGRLGIAVSRDPLPQAWANRQAQAIATLQRSWDGPLAPLPGTRREVLAIRKTVGADKIRVLLGRDATEAQLFELAPQARYLHLATHQLVDETDASGDSRLAFTLPTVVTPSDDGFLHLRDLFEKWRDRLSGCELVVLSACETMRGRMQRNEGPHAMPLGFLYAGAPAVIGSLWRVDDASTAVLFADFYARLAKGTPKLRAFTEARQALKKKYPEPYYWAPFVYIGDPR